MYCLLDAVGEVTERRNQVPARLRQAGVAGDPVQRALELGHHALSPFGPVLGFTIAPARYFVFLVTATSYLILVEIVKRTVIGRRRPAHR